VKAAYGVRLHDIEGSVMSELRSPKQQREHLVRLLRAEGRSWGEVAEVVRQRYRVNARVAFRYAHGGSQRQAADEGNQCGPDELRTFNSGLVSTASCKWYHRRAIQRLRALVPEEPFFHAITGNRSTTALR
jgi:hypothetical protein